ncbi:MAG: hypothetical protein OEM67_06240 [Thermoleophilia bacterium]|nr:hypothetical protein [Thermoleophilia bacterium]MDH3680757.1 hypothetical protein [Acidimicrobiia bacterium]
MGDVDCAVGATPFLTAAADSDCEIDQSEVIYWGHCPPCMEAANGTGARGRARFEVRHISKRGEK